MLDPAVQEPSAARAVVSFATLPVACIISRDGLIVAANAAYEAFMGARAEDVIGQTTDELIRRFVMPPEAPSTTAGQSDEPSADGHLWCRVRDGYGKARTIRVVWHPIPGGGDLAIYLLGAEDEASSKALAEDLARAGGELVRCRDEAEVLDRAVDALFGQGFAVLVLLLREGEPLLEYGPIRSANAADLDPIIASSPLPRPHRDVLTAVNPGFYDRRAEFFQDAAHLVDVAYPVEVAGRFKRLFPGRRMVQAPVFVDGAPFGVLVVTGDALSPSLAGAIEMFAELVARAVENVRLHQRAASRLLELERLQSELVQRERLAALGEAAAVMAHEVRNPIAAILNAVAVLRRRAKGAADEAVMLRAIAEEAARLERMVCDLLDLGRPLLPRISPVNLWELVESSVAVLRRRQECEGVELVVTGQKEDCIALVDPDLVQLAVLNVVRNAAQASPAGRPVVISVHARDGRALLKIEDDGPGFSHDVEERMFEPFFTTRATGTGIGLAVVRRVVEACAGTIETGRSATGGGRVVLLFPEA